MFLSKPKLTYISNVLELSTETNNQDVLFAYDIFCNEEKIKFINYSEKNKIEFDITNYEGIFKIWVFIKNRKGEVQSKFSNSVFVFKNAIKKYSEITYSDLTTGAKLFAIDNTRLPCLYFKKNEPVKHLTVLLSGFVDREKQTLPVFNRWSWASKFPGDVICIADPTLELDEKLYIGWYLGTEKHDLSLDIVKFIKHIAKVKSIPYSNIVFYGSSAGGFAALKFASLVEGSSCVAINPQVDATNHYQEYVQQLLHSAFGGKKAQEVKKLYPNRFLLSKAWENNDKSRIIYVQNKQGVFHYENHFLPFCEHMGLSQTTGKSHNDKHYTFLYDESSGHGPEPDQLVPEIIEKIKEFSNFDLSDRSWKRYVERKYDSIIIEDDNGNINLNNIDAEYIVRLNRKTEIPKKYFDSIEGSMNNANIELAKSAIDRGEYTIPNYGKYQLGIPINWKQVATQEDNFKWYMHSWFYLQNFVKAIMTDSSNMERYRDRLYNELFLWHKHAMNPPTENEFLWNDHSTANRLKLLSEVYVVLLKNNLMTVDLFQLIIKITYQHMLVLSEESFYSKGTNHGIDQAYALFIGSITFRFLGDIAEFTKDLALHRLRFEFDSAFTDECIHVENSPEYHFVILQSALTINSMVHILSSKSILKRPLEEFCNKALEYLAYIIRPDGKIPAIGDSEEKECRSPLDYLSNISNYSSFRYKYTKGVEGAFNLPLSKIFPLSGYAIFQGPVVSDLKNVLHLVVKCGFKSTYHRQDDDTSFVLFAFNEDWLVDGGLYKHDHNDRMRIYFRSHLAHNLIYPDNVKNVKRLLSADTISEMTDVSTDEFPSVLCRTNMYQDFLYSRKIEYNNHYTITISDVLKAEVNDSSVTQLWHFDNNKTFYIEDNTCYVISKNQDVIMKMLFLSENLQEIKLIMDEKTNFRSKAYGKLEKSPTLNIKYKTASDVVVTKIMFLHE